MSFYFYEKHVKWKEVLRRLSKKLFRKLKKIFIWLRKEALVKWEVFKFMKDFYNGLKTDMFSALME